MDKIKQLVDEWEFERSLINKQTENKTDVNAFDTLRKNLHRLEQDIQQTLDSIDQAEVHINSKLKSQTLKEKRKVHGNAYFPWEASADELLTKLFLEGKAIGELSEIFERGKGAIRSRLRKLGLID